MELDYLPGREWQGRVDYIYPTLDSDTRTLRVRMRFDNADHLLKPNMFAQVQIHNETASDILSVPREAVIRGGGNNRVVLALGEGRFKSVHVRTGRSDGDRIEVLNGVREGERVVTSAQFLLDSESSKTSDFKRMYYGDEEAGSAVAQEDSSAPKVKPTRVWVDATVNAVMPEQGKINVSHAAIPDWGWPEMRMDFNVSEFVDMSELAPGAKGQIEVSKLDGGGYEVVDAFITEPGEGGTDSPAMDAMDHSMHTMDQDASGSSEEAQ
jgi:Cu(I)/Ag(I) efflux system membrane fusion protein